MTYGATKPELHATVFEMAKIVAGKFVVNSDGTGPSPPEVQPIQKLATMNSVITNVLLQPTLGTDARQIAAPSDATAAKHFLHLVRLRWPACITLSETSPADNVEIIVAAYRDAFSRPF